MRKIFIIVVISLIVLVVVYGLYLTGTPGSQRQVRFDERRISDLQQISRAISLYHTQTGKLPSNLESLENLDFFVSSLYDPKTDVMYEYTVLDETIYELCGVFEAESFITQKPRFPDLDSWKYQEGRQCFTKEVLVKI